MGRGPHDPSAKSHAGGVVCTSVPVLLLRYGAHDIVMAGVTYKRQVKNWSSHP